MTEGRRPAVMALVLGLIEAYDRLKGDLVERRLSI